MTSPTIEEQIATLERQILSLRESFTIYRGEHDGGITEPDVVRDIEAMECTVALLKRWIE